MVQETLRRAWNARSSYRNEGMEAWRGFLKTTARRCCVDLFRRRSEATLDGAILDETAADEGADTLGALMDALEMQALHHHADILWLGLDPVLSPEAHTRRLLAAQLFYLDGLPWKTVLPLLGPPRPGEPPLTRAALDVWLTDPGVLRHLAYHTLYYDNDRLAAFLLGLDTPGELDAVSRASAASPTLPRDRADGPGGRRP